MPEWAPYRDLRNPTPLATYAEQVVIDLGHEPTVCSLDRRVEDPSDSPTVLLVDPWVGRDTKVSDELRRLDEEPVNALVPFNADDQETVAEEKDLTQSVAAILSRSLSRPGSAMSIPTLEAFRAALPKAVNEAVSRYFKEAPVHPPEIESTMERPTLQLPEK
jgi:FxsC-like protein